MMDNEYKTRTQPPRWLDRVWASDEYVEPDPAPPAGRFRPAVEDFLDGVAQGLGWHDDE